MIREWGKQETLRKTTRDGRLPHHQPPLCFGPLCWLLDFICTHHVVWGLPSWPWGLVLDMERAWEGSTPAEQPQLSQKMCSDVVLRKQLHFLQRLQKPTPCLPLHIFAAEGETAENKSFPDVIGMMLTALSRRHQGVGSGRAGWEVM